MAAAADILILITPQAIAAASLARGQVVALREESRSGGDIVQAVEAALDLIPAKPGRVWLVAADVWSQPVAIQAEIARRVPAAQLAQFVCFEVEPLSGISPREGLAGVVELPRVAGATDPVYWVTEIDRTIFAQLEGLVASRGGRLQALLHPAGAPRPLLEPTAATWRRLEIWPDMVVCLAGDGGRAERQIIARDVGEDWFALARRWFADQPRSIHDEVLVASDDPAAARSAAAMSWRVIDFDERNLAQPWLTAWGSVTAKLTGIPRVTPGRKALTQRTQQMLGAVAVAVAVIGCVAAYQILGMVNRLTVASLQTQTAALTGPTKQAEGARTAIAKLEGDIKQVANREQALEGALARHRDQTRSQKERVPALLAALAETCGGDVLIQRIESDGGQMEVTGRCLDARRANDVVRALAVRLAPLGLEVSLPDKSATFRLGDGGPHDFEFIITDMVKR